MILSYVNDIASIIALFFLFVTLSIFIYQCTKFRKEKSTPIISGHSILMIIGISCNLLSLSVIIMSLISNVEYSQQLVSSFLPLLHLLFFVWRLQLTFRNSAYSLSKYTLILYHIAILLCFTAIFLPNIGEFYTINIYVSKNDKKYNIESKFIYFLITCESLRILILFCISGQFSYKLQELTTTQHVYNHYHTLLSDSNSNINSTKMNCHKTANFSISDIDSDYSNNSNNTNYRKRYDTELSLKDTKMIVLISKLTLLTIFDFVLLISMTISQIFYYTHLSSDIAYSILHIVYLLYLIDLGLTTWLSFIFAEKQYYCLLGCCQNSLMKSCINITKYRIHYVRAVNSQTSM